MASVETYFLVKNERATDDAIVGRPSGGQKVTNHKAKSSSKTKEGKSCVPSSCTKKREVLVLVNSKNILRV